MSLTPGQGPNPNPNPVYRPNPEHDRDALKERRKKMKRNSKYRIPEMQWANPKYRVPFHGSNDSLPDRYRRRFTPEERENMYVDQFIKNHPKEFQRIMAREKKRSPDLDAREQAKNVLRAVHRHREHWLEAHGYRSDDPAYMRNVGYRLYARQMQERRKKERERRENTVYDQDSSQKDAPPGMATDNFRTDEMHRPVHFGDADLDDSGHRTKRNMDDDDGHDHNVVRPRGTTVQKQGTEPAPPAHHTNTGSAVDQHVPALRYTQDHQTESDAQLGNKRKYEQSFADPYHGVPMNIAKYRRAGERALYGQGPMNPNLQNELVDVTPWNHPILRYHLTHRVPMTTPNRVAEGARAGTMAQNPPRGQTQTINLNQLFLTGQNQGNRGNGGPNYDGGGGMGGGGDGGDGGDGDGTSPSPPALPPPMPAPPAPQPGGGGGGRGGRGGRTGADELSWDERAQNEEPLYVTLGTEGALAGGYAAYRYGPQAYRNAAQYMRRRNLRRRGGDGPEDIEMDDLERRPLNQDPEFRRYQEWKQNYERRLEERDEQRLEEQKNLFENRRSINERLRRRLRRRVDQRRGSFDDEPNEDLFNPRKSRSNSLNEPDDQTKRLYENEEYGSEQYEPTERNVLDLDKKEMQEIYTNEEQFGENVSNFVVREEAADGALVEGAEAAEGTELLLGGAETLEGVEAADVILTALEFAPFLLL